MASEIYELIVRPRQTGAADAAGPSVAVERSELERRLGNIPGVQPDGPGRFSFGEPDTHGSMQFEISDTINIRIPRPWVMERGPQVFALVFMVAEWSAGEVYDPQIDDTLKKDHVLQGMVAMRQARLEQKADTPPAMQTQPAQQMQEDKPAPTRRPWFKLRR